MSLVTFARQVSLERDRFPIRSFSESNGNKLPDVFYELRGRKRVWGLVGWRHNVFSSTRLLILSPPLLCFFKEKRKTQKHEDAGNNCKNVLRSRANAQSHILSRLKNIPSKAIVSQKIEELLADNFHQSSLVKNIKLAFKTVAC